MLRKIKETTLKFLGLFLNSQVQVQFFSPKKVNIQSFILRNYNFTAYLNMIIKFQLSRLN